ncbi:ABC transporter permease [Pantoea agglomerans]|nr:ABC transporter permease [Pantoea agglomerans]
MTDLMPEPERRNYRSRKIYGPSFWQIFTAAVDSIRYLGRRAVLALTGIAAGSAIVVALINIGNMAQLESANVFQGMGGDILMANFQPAPGRPVTGFMPGDIDMALLVSSLDASVKAAGIVMTASELPSGQSRMPVVLIGQSGNLEDIMGLKLQHGRFLTRTDASSTYVLIGSELARGRHIGEQIRLGGVYLYHYWYSGPSRE